ncbi:MAG: winged helix-turn-helix domain-containing protein [Victivallaceae bacterium]|nr:winged helix-turn-helix domain-containing protein [Victivallaceae bacterium]
MALLTVTSKKDQVADFLREQLLSGKIEPGAKLLSVRALAKEFSVSTMIIVDALDILEEELLITREPGRGVFSSKHNLKHSLGICLFAYQVRPQRDLYFTNLVRMTQPPFLHEGFSFNIRMIPENSNVTYQHFLQELTKIDKYMDVDCLLMNVPFLNKQQITACMKLNTPVIFIGDFSAGLYPELPYNQIAGDCAWLGQSVIRQVAELEQCRELTVYSGSLEHYFNRNFYDGALNEAKQLGIELRLIEFPRGITSSSAESEQWTIYQDKVKAAVDKGWHKCPAIISGGISDELLLNAFSGYDIDVAVYDGKECEKSFEQFFETIYARIETVVNNPKDYKKIRFKSKINVKKINS